MKLLIAATLIASTSAMSAGYLQNLASNAAVAGAGIGGYLDALPIATSAPTAGPGMANYLDSVTAPAPVAPAPVAPVAVAPTPVAPAAPAASDAAPAPSAGDYLNHLSGGNSISGAGLRTHVDTLTINSAPTGTGAVFSSYLGLLPANSAGVSGSGLQSYTDMLLSCSAIEGGAAAPVAAGIAAATSVSAGAGNFLESVYNQISTLTAEDVASVGGTLSQSGGSVAFAATSGSTSMTFIKK